MPREATAYSVPSFNQIPSYSHSPFLLINRSPATISTQKRKLTSFSSPSSLHLRLHYPTSNNPHSLTLPLQLRSMPSCFWDDTAPFCQGDGSDCENFAYHPVSKRDLYSQNKRPSWTGEESGEEWCLRSQLSTLCRRLWKRRKSNQGPSSVPGIFGR